MGDRSRDVEWQIAADPAMTHVVRHGHVSTRAELAHSVHVTVDGLLPGRDYWYRFRSGRWLSPIARTKTAPAPAAPVRRLDFAAASCQSWTDGFYTAHRHLADEAVDVVLFLGDYVYEHAIDHGVRVPPTDLAAEADSLERYRMRYALYKLDPDLQAAHHSAPWIVTWDDHEVVNDYAGSSIASARRADAYRAFWEHQPLRVRRPLRAHHAVAPALRVRCRSPSSTCSTPASTAPRASRESTGNETRRHGEIRCDPCSGRSRKRGSPAGSAGPPRRGTCSANR